MSEQLKNDTPAESAVVLMFAGKAAEAEVEKDSAMGKLRNAYAQAKTAGVDVDALKAARKLVSSKKKPDEITAAIKTLGRTAQYAAMLNAKAMSQVDLFEYLSAMDDTPTSRDAEIYQEGRAAALMGAGDVPPQEYGNSDQNHWCEGYQEGKRERETVMSMLSDLEAQEDADDLDDELPEDDVDDDDSEGGAPAVAETPDDPVMDNVTSFRREVEAATDDTPEPDPDIPASLDRRNWENGQPPQTNPDAA